MEASWKLRAGSGDFVQAQETSCKLRGPHGSFMHGLVVEVHEAGCLGHLLPNRTPSLPLPTLPTLKAFVQFASQIISHNPSSFKEDWCSQTLYCVERLFPTLTSFRLYHRVKTLLAACTAHTPLDCFFMHVRPFLCLLSRYGDLLASKQAMAAGSTTLLSRLRASATSPTSSFSPMALASR